MRRPDGWSPFAIGLAVGVVMFMLAVGGLIWLDGGF